MKSMSPRKLRRQQPQRLSKARQRLATETAALMETSIDYISCPDFRTVPKDELLADLKPPAVLAKQTVQAPADTPPYLAALYDFPLLTKDEEYQIFRKMHFLRFQAAQLQKKLSLSSLNAQRVAQIRDLLRQADDVRNRIVQCNLRLVVSIAKTLVNSANSLDDLISEGNFPLIRAAELFDYTRGLRFSTYATWAVRNGLYRTSSRNHRNQQRFRVDASERLSQAPQPTSEAEHRDETIDAERLHQLVSQLDRRSQTILRDRFALGGEARPARFHELGKKLKLSSERVRQLLDRALSQLRSLDAGLGSTG